MVQEKLASLGALTAGIAHEIKNPLNFVNNFAELSMELATELQAALETQREVLGPAVYEDVTGLAADLVLNARKINEHGRRADSIIRGMLLHSRGHSGERQDTDVNARPRGIRQPVLPRHARAGLVVQRHARAELRPTTGTVRAVPQDISRVFLNLVNNACYATHERKQQADERGEQGYVPTLTVATRNLGETVEVRIRDNGKGIPPEVRDRIFNPFFTTKPTGQGTGLGLSISHDIVVQQHHGQLEVDSVPGQFTEFVVRLPRASSGSGGGAGALMSGEGGPMKIVVVDDEHDVQALFEQRFRREVRSGLIELNFAFSGEDALTLLENRGIADIILILSDINMPGMNGLELLKAIKARYPELKVYMVTAYGDEPRTSARCNPVATTISPSQSTSRS